MIRKVIGRALSRFSDDLFDVGAWLGFGVGVDVGLGGADGLATLVDGTGAGATVASSTYVRLLIASNTLRHVPQRTRPPRSFN